MRHDFLRTPLSIALILGMSVSSAFAVEKGESNPKNNTRSVGPAGPQGLQGPQGIQGIKGDAGTNGSIGPQGIKGDTGLTGPAGADSMVPGPVGPRGAPGTPQAGNDVGDMQYWDGIQWVEIKAPVKEPAILRYKNGVPVWSAYYMLGDTGPAGGKVFYITDGGAHGLEVAPVNQSGGALLCNARYFFAGYGVQVGTGAANTDAFVLKCPGYAASIAADYSLNGYSDWYLPSIDELNLLYSQKERIGDFNSAYWSSSISALGGYFQFQDFRNGLQQGTYPDTSFSVRAIRNF